MVAATAPTVIRVALPYPDAVIVRKPDGRLYVVADHAVPDERVADLAREAPHVRDGRPFGALGAP